VVRKPKKKTVGYWKKKAWESFSRWIRNRDKGVCFTCNRPCEGAGYHAGHYIPRSLSGYLYFDERNVHGQCYRCNIHLSGNADEYAVRLGENIVAELRADKNKYRQWTEKDLREIIEKYGTGSIRKETGDD
jgi:hypothetical protein